MRRRTVLILLILTVGLVAFIELYESELPSTDERAAIARSVFDLRASDITAVELRWNGKRARLERAPTLETRVDETNGESPSEWNLVEPFAAPADAALVTSLIESLTTMQKTRSLVGADAVESGLEPPRLEAILAAEGREVELEIGNQIPAGDSIIVRTSERGEISVVEGSIWQSLTREPGDWRRREVFDLDRQGVHRVVLSREDQRLSLAKRNGDFWLESPLTDRADKDMVDDLLATLIAMRIDAFEDEFAEPMPERTLDPPSARLEITVRGVAKPLTLSWGRPVEGSAGHHYARFGNRVFATASPLQPHFDRSPEAWRSLRLTSVGTYQIDSLQIDQVGYSSMGLVRIGANWQRGEEEISFTSVSDLLYALTGARAVALSAESKPELLNNALRPVDLQVTMRGDGMEQSVSFYALPEADVRAVVDDRDAVLLVSGNEFTEILTMVEEVRAAAAVKSAVGEQLLTDEPELNTD